MQTEAIGHWLSSALLQGAWDRQRSKAWTADLFRQASRQTTEWVIDLGSVVVAGDQCLCNWIFGKSICFPSSLPALCPGKFPARISMGGTSPSNMQTTKQHCAHTRLTPGIVPRYSEFSYPSWALSLTVGSKQQEEVHGHRSPMITTTAAHGVVRLPRREHVSKIGDAYFEPLVTLLLHTHTVDGTLLPRAPWRAASQTSENTRFPHADQEPATLKNPRLCQCMDGTDSLDCRPSISLLRTDSCSNRAEKGPLLSQAKLSWHSVHFPTSINHLRVLAIEGFPPLPTWRSWSCFLEGRQVCEQRHGLVSNIVVHSVAKRSKSACRCHARACTNRWRKRMPHLKFFRFCFQAELPWEDTGLTWHSKGWAVWDVFRPFLFESAQCYVCACFLMGQGGGFQVLLHKDISLFWERVLGLGRCSHGLQYLLQI